MKGAHLDAGRARLHTRLELGRRLVGKGQDENAVRGHVGGRAEVLNSRGDDAGFTGAGTGLDAEEATRSMRRTRGGTLLWI